MTARFGEQFLRLLATPLLSKLPRETGRDRSDEKQIKRNKGKTTQQLLRYARRNFNTTVLSTVSWRLNWDLLRFHHQKKRGKKVNKYVERPQEEASRTCAGSSGKQKHNRRTSLGPNLQERRRNKRTKEQNKKEPEKRQLGARRIRGRKKHVSIPQLTVPNKIKSQITPCFLHVVKRHPIPTATLTDDEPLLHALSTVGGAWVRDAV